MPPSASALLAYAANWTRSLAAKSSADGSSPSPWAGSQRVTKPCTNWLASVAVCSIWSRSSTGSSARSPRMPEISGAGAPATMPSISSDSATPDRSMSTLPISMPEKSKPERSRPAPSLDASTENAARNPDSSTLNRLERSTPPLASSCRVANDLPVNTSTSGLPSCCWTICEFAARAMSSSVRPCV